MSAAETGAFKSDRLQKLHDAFLQRRKAIKYQAKEFALSREIKDSTERLLVIWVSLFRVRLCLSVWSDGIFWLGVTKSGTSRKGGYEHYETFDGTLNCLTSPEVVALFEKTMLCPMEAKSIWQQ
jgi:hypothetical protein